MRYKYRTNRMPHLGSRIAQTVCFPLRRRRLRHLVAASSKNDENRPITSPTVRLVYLQKYNYTIVVSGVRFDWDEAKNLSNQRKHGVSFEEASQVFLDPLFVSLKERIEDDEQRWQTYGEVRSCLLVMVAHTVREVDKHGEMVEVMRIISARYASRKERQRYEDENR